MCVAVRRARPSEDRACSKRSTAGFLGGGSAGRAAARSAMIRLIERGDCSEIRASQDGFLLSARGSSTGLASKEAAEYGVSSIRVEWRARCASLGRVMNEDRAASTLAPRSGPCANGRAHGGVPFVDNQPDGAGKSEDTRRHDQGDIAVVGRRVACWRRRRDGCVRKPLAGLPRI